VGQAFGAVDELPLAAPEFAHVAGEGVPRDGLVLDQRGDVGIDDEDDVSPASTGRSSSRSADPTAATVVAAETSSSS